MKVLLVCLIFIFAACATVTKSNQSTQQLTEVQKEEKSAKDKKREPTSQTWSVGAERP